MRTPFTWRLRSRALTLGPRTLLMGIVNVTPDSFSDGGLFSSPATALDHALRLLDEGADILDLGGESTRPNAGPISPEEEQARVLPVLTALLKARPDAILSIDTFHADTARRAIEAGAEIVNDVSGHTWDAEMSRTCADLGCGAVLMHTRGRPGEWATQPRLAPVAVMPVVLTGLRDLLLAARSAGVEAARILLDPGFGFGKQGDENYIILAMLRQLHQFGLPLMAGLSRKGFLGQTLAPLYGGVPSPDSEERLRATAATNVAAVLAGAHILRVHDVRAAVAASTIADAILTAEASVASATSAFARISSTTPQ